MRRKNFLLGVLVGAMLAGGTFLVSTVDARSGTLGPRKPGRSDPIPTAPNRKKARVVYECPDRIDVAPTVKVLGVPSGWEANRPVAIRQSFERSSFTPNPSVGPSVLHCDYSFPAAPHLDAGLTRDVEGTDCSFSDGGRKLTCYK